MNQHAIKSKVCEVSHEEAIDTLQESQFIQSLDLGSALLSWVELPCGSTAVVLTTSCGRAAIIR